MPGVACTRCHVFKNGEYLQPEKTLCSDCHPGGPHVVHGDRLSEMCRRCHGEFGEQFAEGGGPEIMLSGFASSGGSELSPVRVLSQINATQSATQRGSSGFVTLGERISDMILRIVSVFGG